MVSCFGVLLLIVVEVDGIVEVIVVVGKKVVVTAVLISEVSTELCVGAIDDELIVDISD